jgi:hypothetical protein
MTTNTTTTTIRQTLPTDAEFETWRLSLKDNGRRLVMEEMSINWKIHLGIHPMTIAAFRRRGIAEFILIRHDGRTKDVWFARLTALGWEWRNWLERRQDGIANRRHLRERLRLRRQIQKQKKAIKKGEVKDDATD